MRTGELPISYVSDQAIPAVIGPHHGHEGTGAVRKGWKVMSPKTSLPVPPGFEMELNGPLAAPHQLLLACTAMDVVFSAPDPDVALNAILLSGNALRRCPAWGMAGSTQRPISKPVMRLLVSIKLVIYWLPVSDVQTGAAGAVVTNQQIPSNGAANRLIDLECQAVTAEVEDIAECRQAHPSTGAIAADTHRW